MHTATVKVLVVLYVLGLSQLAVLAASHTAAAAATAGDLTFPSCDTGASRVVLANLEHLPLQCKPGHKPISAAVLECFASSRVTVRKCKVSVTPGRATSKAGLDCRVMHAQGYLLGSSNATLTAVLNGPKAASLLQSSTRTSVLQGLDASKLQQQLIQGLQLLFGQVVVTGPRNSSSSSSSRHSGSGGAHTTTSPLPPAAGGGGGAAGQQGNRNGSQQAAAAAAGGDSAALASVDKNVTTGPPVPAELQPRRRHPRQRQGQHKGRQQRHGNSTSTNSTGTEGHMQRQQGRRRRKHAPDTAAAAAAAQPPAADQVEGTDAEQAGSSKRPEAPPSTAANGMSSTPTNASSSSSSSSNSSSSSRPVPPTAAAATGAAAPHNSTDTLAGVKGAGTHTGRRRLQGPATSLTAAATQTERRRGRALVASASEATSDANGSDMTDVSEYDQEADQATAAAAGIAAKGAVLSRQGNSIMLQPSSSCSFQFMVTRNPTLLQDDSEAAAAAESAVSASRRHNSSSSGSWWVSLGALFAGVSAVLALIICYMSAQLWSRYKSYEALPSEPHPNDEQRQGPAQAAAAAGSSSTARPAVVFYSPDLQPVRDVPEMSLELQQTRSKAANGTFETGGTAPSRQDQA